MQRKCGQLYEHDRKPGSCIYRCRTVQYTLKLYTLTIPRHIYKKIIKKKPPWAIDIWYGNEFKPAGNNLYYAYIFLKYMYKHWLCENKAVLIVKTTRSRINWGNHNNLVIIWTFAKPQNHTNTSEINNGCILIDMHSTFKVWAIALFFLKRNYI